MQSQAITTPKYSDIKQQLQAVASTESELHHFTKALLAAPELTTEAKQKILNIESEYITDRIHHICTGGQPRLKRTICNPATLLSTGAL